MSGHQLVIVESPAKAKTINKYLGPGYEVLASYGHVRDLPAKDGSVLPDQDFKMEWELGERSKKPLDAIVKAAKGASRIYLATDPDREGEAISWHVQQVLQGKKGLGTLDFQRVTFNEITKSAVQEAMRHPRDVNAELVQAYLARRALDYLVGFTLSPVLWRKLPGARSAGRVQSVALRLVCEREAEIERFVPREYWSIEAVFVTTNDETFTARLTHLDGKKVEKFDLKDEAGAKAALAELERRLWAIASVETKQVRRNPYPPFTTSTLQQEASRQLGFSASQTMRTAQRLYEGIDLGGETVGLITYMRTDGLTLASEAIAGARRTIEQSFGQRYLPDSPRIYKSTAKNAQEAHEAIRPTDLGRKPDQVARNLERDELRLYDLIWKRTIACQMASALLDQVSIDVAATDRFATFRATGSIVRFDGFLRVYEEARDDPAEGEDDSQRRLPDVKTGQSVTRKTITPNQHFTEPLPRFTEASLVKRLEELGIGRPSTYASILQVLQDRDYVRLEKKRFVPEDRGRLVTAFLTSFFGRYVEYDFTAQLEDRLDDISGGRIDWKQVLRDFWQAFSAAIDGTKGLTITQVIDELDKELGPHFFVTPADGSDPRLCPVCHTGRLGLRLGRGGAFIGCSNYPECRYTRPLEVLEPGAAEEASQYPRVLGNDPQSGLPVSVRKGPFGFYVQLGEGNGGEKPKRVSLTAVDVPMEIGLERALGLLALPRTIGRHPESGEVIDAGIGRYGPYIKHGSRYVNLPADDDVLAVGMNRAIDLLAGSRRGGSAPAAAPLHSLGEHPSEGGEIAVFKGRYGPYVRHGKVMASLPRGLPPEELTVDRAVELLAAKAASPSSKKKRAPAKTPGKTKANGRAKAAKKR